MESISLQASILKIVLQSFYDIMKKFDEKDFISYKELKINLCNKAIKE